MSVVTGNTNLSANFTQQKLTGVIGTQSLTAAESLTTGYTNGTGAGAVDLLYAASLTLAATPTTINLQSFTDIFGASTQNMARARVIMIRNTDTVAGHTIIVGAAAANPYTGFLNAAGTITIPPGGRIIIEDPTSLSTAGGVTGASSLNLKLDPGANTVTCEVVIAGGSAAS